METGGSQQSKQKQNKIKIGIFTAIFLLTQYFSVFQIISRNWKHLINDEVQAKKAFWNVILHSSLCNASCKFFIKIESNQRFVKHILNQARKKLFCRVIAKNYLCNFLCKFLIEMKAHRGLKPKSKQPRWLYRTVIGLPEVAIGGFLLK